MFSIKVKNCNECPYNSSANDGSSDRVCDQLDELYDYPDGEDADDIVIPKYVLNNKIIWEDCPRYPELREVEP